MNDPAPPSTDASTPAVLPVDVGDARSARMRRAPLAMAIGASLLALIAVAALVYAWRADQRVHRIEQELVRRQQESGGEAAEARLLAKQAQDSARESAAKTALLEARVAEVALQRTQLEELMQSLSRSRDENLLTDVEAAIRVAVQQSAITGSAEPLVATLKQSDERLARVSQPRLDGVRRAIARDLDRVKAASVADIATLAIRLDEAIRMADELPLLSNAQARGDPARTAAAAAAASRSASRSAGIASSASGPAASGSAVARWSEHVRGTLSQAWSELWDEVRSLVRVTRIDHPDAVLLAPDQAFFLRENLKLRLLNARLALLSRQFDTAQQDLQAALVMIDRYFDRSARRTQIAQELVRQVAAQAKQGGVPRPDDTLAAVAAAVAGR
ncbi:MAG TPA: uroporphyrinogen-III C-methyltransferase [Caldimonas sp.]|nr:uroporphyrinogen-III C-methyltransferase [Caldimonas sp.]